MATQAARIQPGNRLYLVCSHHPRKEDAIQLGRRLSDGYFRPPAAGELRDWFDRHSQCGGDQDHFVTAFDLPKDHDKPKAESAASEPIQAGTHG